MQTNPEIEQILSQAQRLARIKKHEYVTVEHLTLALVRHGPFAATLDQYGVAIDLLDKDLEDYIDSQVHLINDKEWSPERLLHWSVSLTEHLHRLCLVDAD